MVKNILISFAKHIYTFFILFASDPFDIAERWFDVIYQPPFWLFYVLLAVAIGSASWLTVLDLRRIKRQVAIERIPNLLRSMSRHLRMKVQKMIKSTYNLNEMGILGEIVKKCTRVYGLQKELPVPKTIPITERYRKSIENKVSKDVLEHVKNPDTGWEYHLKVGGILDHNNYGLQTEEDARYKNLEAQVRNIVDEYIGYGSKDLTKTTNDYLLRMYSAYSYLLFTNYWEVLVGFCKTHGVPNIIDPELEGIIGVKHKGIERYLSEELEKVRRCINRILMEAKRQNRK